MPLVKKVNPEWVPAEKKDLQVGDIIDMTNAEDLVRLGAAVYVDVNGVELQRPNSASLRCPTCTMITDDQYKLAYHILSAHPRKVEKVAVDGTELAPEGATSSPTLVESAKPENTEKEEVVVEPTTEEPTTGKSFKDMTDEEKKAWRIANLARAREAAQAKKQNAEN